jgi:hypothetical protein
VKTLSAHTRHTDFARQGHPANPNYHGKWFNTAYTSHRANRSQGSHRHTAGTFSAVVGQKRAAEPISHYTERAKAMAETRFTKAEMARSFASRCPVCDQPGHDSLKYAFLEATVQWENTPAPPTTTASLGGGSAHRGLGYTQRAGAP